MFLPKGISMVPKQFFIITLLCMSYTTQPTTFLLNETPYQEQARAWSTSYLCHTDGTLLVSEHDLMFIANLCYLSFMRSYRTLKAQDAALTALTALWQGWQNIAQTRLDPSIKTPYNICEQAQKITGEQFWSEHDKHRTTGLTYARAVETIVHGNELATASAVHGVTDLRASARVVMTQALVNVKAYLDSLFKREPTKGFMDLWKGFCFIKHLATYSSQLALNTFSTAEELNNTVGNAGFRALEATQFVGAQTWRAIEQARASFYLAHYHVVAALLSKKNLKAPLMFNPKGLIPEHQQTKTLPSHIILNK